MTNSASAARLKARTAQGEAKKPAHVTATATVPSQAAQATMAGAVIALQAGDDPNDEGSDENHREILRGVAVRVQACSKPEA